MEQRSRSFVSAVGSIVAALLVFIGGFYAGKHSAPAVGSFGAVSGKEASVEADFAPFWKAWQLLEEKHVGDTQVDGQAKVWAAIEGLASAFGDPYTVFFPPEEAKAFEDDISGNFSGVGIEVGIRDGVLTVIAPLKASPAARAGVRSGDKIIQIDSKVTNNLSTDQAVKLIRGAPGTSVTLTLVRAGS
jgi:carboxyl-terminal processing protease